MFRKVRSIIRPPYEIARCLGWNTTSNTDAYSDPIRIDGSRVVRSKVASEPLGNKASLIQTRFREQDDELLASETIGTVTDAQAITHYMRQSLQDTVSFWMPVSPLRQDSCPTCLI